MAAPHRRSLPAYCSSAPLCHLHLSWLLFGVLFLAPDFFMLGYLMNPRTGAAIYNLGHVLLVPLGLFLVGTARTGRFCSPSPSSGAPTSPSTGCWAMG